MERCTTHCAVGLATGKIIYTPPVWRFENEGGLVSRNQLRLSRTKRKSAAAESQNKSGGWGPVGV